MSVFFFIIAGLGGLALGWLLGRQGAQAETGALRERAAKAETEAAEARRQLEGDGQRLAQLKAELAAESARLLKEQSGELRAEAGRHFDGVVAPLRQNLEDLKGLASRMSEQDARDRATLSEQVKRLAEAHLTFSAKADELALSLRGNVKSQGQWGEVLLQRVLELSGLAKGAQYVLQGEGLDLRASDGSLQKPDAVILLPDGKHLVIDAKAPLEGYFNSLTAVDEGGRTEALLALVKALKTQVSGLSARQYHANEKLISPEFTLLFVPIEAALGAALQQDPLLFEMAWEKRVMLVGPNMLFGTLKVIGQIWGQEKRNKNAEEIAKRGGQLYEKLVGFVLDFAKAKEYLLEAQKKLVEGTGNVVWQAEKLKELGAKTDKSLPKAWVDQAQGD